MESSNESDEAKAHHEDNRRADLQTGRIIGIESEHIVGVARANYATTTTTCGRGGTTEPTSAHASCSGGGATGCGGTRTGGGGGSGLGRSASRHYLGVVGLGRSVLLGVVESDYYDKFEVREGESILNGNSGAVIMTCEFN